MDLFLCNEITRREDAYALLAFVARRRWGLEQLPVIARGNQGKPFFPAYPEYHFNLSHSGSFALCAVDEHPAGADIEVIRPHHPNLAGRICSPEERTWLEHQIDKTTALCQLWTAKEALVKYHGTGLTVPLRDICVPLPPHGKQNDLVFHSICTQSFCLCVCGHTAPTPLAIVSRKEISD